MTFLMTVTPMAVVAGQAEDGRAAAMRETYAEAMKTFRKAAEQGDAHAQYDLGFGYANGLGVP